MLKYFRDYLFSNNDNHNRNHNLNECAETKEVKTGIYTRERCEACRIEMFTYDGNK